MKAFFVGDLQAHAWSTYSTPRLDGVNDRLLDIVAELARIRQLAKERGIRTIIFLGDVFQERGRLDITVLNLIFRAIEAFRRDGLFVLLLLGNHDRAPVGPFHALEVFQPIVTVVTEPTVIVVEGLSVLAIPFLAETREISQWLAKHGKTADLILLHTAVRDITLPSGEQWSEGISLREIPNRWTFMGHYHKFTQLRPNCFYVGSLLQNNWGEANDPKVFGQFIGNTVTWIPTQGPVFLDVTTEEVTTRTDLRGNFVRVQWLGPLDEVGAVRSYLLDTVGARAVDFTFPATTFSTEAVTRLAEDPRVHELVLSYLKAVPLAERMGLLETGRAILIEAEQLSEDCSDET